MYYQRRCGTTILPSFHSTAHAQAVLKAGGSKCLRMPNMASQNPENSVGETRCWTILIYPYLSLSHLIYLFNVSTRIVLGRCFPTRDQQEPPHLSQAPQRRLRLSCAKCYVSIGESPHEQMFLREPMRKLLCGAVSNFKTFKSGRRWGRERFMQLVPCTFNKLYGIVR